MTTLNITTVKMIIAAVGTLVFLSLFSVATQYQEVSLKSCTNLSSSQTIETTQSNCLSANNLLLDITG